MRNCRGLGVIYTDLAALGEAKTPFEICEGQRFKDEALAWVTCGCCCVFCPRATPEKPSIPSPAITTNHRRSIWAAVPQAGALG